MGSVVVRGVVVVTSELSSKDSVGTFSIVSSDLSTDSVDSVLSLRSSIVPRPVVASLMSVPVVCNAVV